MRRVALGFLLLLCAGAPAQLRPEETQALDDAMVLANLRPSDLGGLPAPVDAVREHLAALQDPVAGLTRAMAFHAKATNDDPALLRTAVSLTAPVSNDTKVPNVVVLPNAVPESLRRPIGALVGSIVYANAEIRAATARLSEGERRSLIEGLPRLALDDPTIPLDYAKAAGKELGEVRRLAGLVDVARIESASVVLATAVRDALPALRASRANVVSTTFRVDGIVVELSGSGNDVHTRKDVGLCIDFGGDDRYTGRYGTGVGYAGVLIDLGGNDRYSGADLNFGAGLLGIGILSDLGGDDVYSVRTAGLGCGLAGVGILSDSNGDDRYRVVNFGLGAAIRGVGLAVDRLGDDAREVARGGEGFGAWGGTGWCVDGSGDDTYRGGEWSQASARAGGYALLTDLSGNDVYRTGSGQAWAEGGYASLCDLSGEDQYTAESAAQSFSAKGGVAYLIDASGNDAYLLREGPGQAAAFAGVSVLFDREGDDVYGGTDGAPAMAVEGGVAILLDGAGDDRYLASSPIRKEDDGVSLSIDVQGHDAYGDGRLDAQASAAQSVAAYDVYSQQESTPQDPMSSVGGSPLPSTAEMIALRRQALSGPDRRGAMVRLLAIGVPALEALAADPEGEEAFVALASRLGNVAAPTVARLAGSPDPRLARMAFRTAGFVPLPAEIVVAALDRPDLVDAAVVAAGRGKVREAVPALNERAASDNVQEVRAAVEALAEIGYPQGASTAGALIDSADLATRQAAFRLVESVPAQARATGLRLIASAEGFRQRIGIALLGRVGTPESLSTIGELLTRGGRDARIGALVALDGRVPTSLIATVEALRRDPDPLVRAVAARTDVGP